MTPLLLDLVEILKQNGSARPGKVSAYVQTEEAGAEAMTLDQKLRKLEFDFRDKADFERAMPFKTLEERMLKYK
jgi:hypothetical protein